MLIDIIFHRGKPRIFKVSQDWRSLIQMLITRPEKEIVPMLQALDDPGPEDFMQEDFELSIHLPAKKVTLTYIGHHRFFGSCTDCWPFSKVNEVVIENAMINRLLSGSAVQPLA